MAWFAWPILLPRLIGDTGLGRRSERRVIVQD